MDFYLPARLITGRGAVARSADRIAAFGDRCLIVTGGSAARKCGALDDVTAVLEERGIAYKIYDAIQPNPSIASCVEGGRLAARFQADFVIGIGGGSPLDAAKVIALSARNPELDAEGLYSMQWPNPPLPAVLVGTTAGTGSEMTGVAVITDTAGRKHSFHGESFYAALSIGDPRYTESVPLRVTASTGVDALAHCLESCFCKTANEISVALAVQGISMLLQPLSNIAKGNLPTPVEREILYQASILGGMAISITGTCMPHNLGYYLTETCGTPHGFACALFEPALLRHAQSCAPQYTVQVLEKADTDAAELSALIRALTPEPELRLSEEELEAILPRWENNASIRKTVGELTKDHIREIWREALSL
ncbi:MAG: iron-containing alcohol dehydrogenase [Oscillospiraceae bacterium]|nr:iron-containing alcohol dehydrogenase [Oscillospiraceae bacterium]